MNRRLTLAIVAVASCAILALDIAVANLPAASADAVPTGAALAQAPTEAWPAGTVYLPNPPLTPVSTAHVAPAGKPTPKPTPRDTVWNAKAYARNRLGATQYACLDRIFTYESKWNPLATNRSSGAYGIPQALPGSKMATFGSNWRTSPLTQVKWGIWYVNERYGSACAAWAHIESSGWY